MQKPSPDHGVCWPRTTAPAESQHKSSSIWPSKPWPCRWYQHRPLQRWHRAWAAEMAQRRLVSVLRNGWRRSQFPAAARCGHGGFDYVALADQDDLAPRPFGRLPAAAADGREGLSRATSPPSGRVVKGGDRQSPAAATPGLQFESPGRNCAGMLAAAGAGAANLGTPAGGRRCEKAGFHDWLIYLGACLGVTSG